MKRKMFLAAMLMMAIGLQTSQAQTLRIWQNGKADTYDISMVDSVQFVESEFEWVDLGLPSGTLWATCNIGAHSPEEYGDYFAWGETQSKGYYGWESYAHCDYEEVSAIVSMTKYYDSYSGAVGADDLTELLPEDDVATAKWGQEWQMPSNAQITELVDGSCTTTNLENVNGVMGWKITSNTNGNSIFLPSAGYRQFSGLILEDKGYYWSRSLLEYEYTYGKCLYLTSNNIRVWNGERFFGMTVRPVRVQESPYELADTLALLSMMKALTASTGCVRTT